MKQYAVDAAHQDVHIKAHQHFTAQVTVAAKILLGSTDVTNQLVAPLLKYLTNWLVQHILGSDTRMGQEILALQAGASHEEAVRKATAFMTQSANVLMEALERNVRQARRQDAGGHPEEPGAGSRAGSAASVERPIGRTGKAAYRGL